MNNNASFGACTSSGAIPPTYHPHYLPPTNNALAEVYDWGHDGWTVGTPVYMGDYTYPGSPFEGWELQIGGTGRVQAFQNCAGTMMASIGGMTMTGSLTSYSNIAGSARGTWTGNATMSGATLAIRQVTRIDTLASAVVVTTVLKNTSATAAPDVYYLRSCDPDNGQTWSGNFSTVNKIVHQNEDARHLVQVKSYDASLTETKSYMALATKDCRAKCFIYTSWWLGSTIDLATVWNETYGSPGSSVQYTLGACLPPSCGASDIAIGLVYKIGTIAAGDSAIISYAYVFNGDAGIEDAFPDPVIALNGTVQPLVPVPNDNHDTIDVCLTPGVTSINVDLFNSDDKNWSWSTWTWSPGLGLATTTGIHNVITTTGLPPVFTYTITGTDSASGMTSCLNKTFYLTVITCNGAEVNSPCEGDTLWFNAPGDSTGATYQWYGPAPSTSIFATTQKTFIYPASTAHNGSYHVIKTVAGVPDTSETTATVHHKPVLTVTSNAPLCIGAANTLLLFANTDSAVAAYDWTSTTGFTSALANPTIAGFSTADTGMYTVVVTTSYGCKDTGQVPVTLVPPPPPPVVTALTPYCKDDLFMPFSVSGIAAGATVQWYNVGTGGTPSPTAPVVNTAVPGSYTYWFTQTIGSCESLRDSVTVVVNPKPVTDFLPDPHPGCPLDTVIFTNTTAGATVYQWLFGDGLSSTDANPVHYYTTNQDSYNVTLKATNIFGCYSTNTQTINVRHRITADFSFSDSIVCNGTPVTVNDLSFFTKFNTTPLTVMVCDWTFGDGNTQTENGGVSVNHLYEKEGYYHVTLHVTDSIGCEATISKDVLIIQPHISAVIDTTFCLPDGVVFPFNVIMSTTPVTPLNDYYNFLWTPNDGHLSSVTDQNPNFTGLGDYTYTLTATLNTEGCSAEHVVTLHSTLPTPLTNVTKDTKIMYGNSIQLNADSTMFYTWTPNDGSLNNPNINNPVATPTVTTTYTVYGMDKYGCRDTAFITVFVDSTQTEFIPTAFTPNGDGKNDVFRLIGSKFHHLLEFRIYNRWGQQVFYTATKEQGWDGTFNGVPQDMGVYYYTIICARPGYFENIVYKGEVTLIR